MAYKNRYGIGDKVTTPLGTGEIIAIREGERTINHFMVKHENFCDHDGDSFEFPSPMLTHVRG